MRILPLMLGAVIAAGRVSAAVLATENFTGSNAGWVERDPVGGMTYSYNAGFGSGGAGSLQGTFATQALAFVQTDAFRATNSSSSGSFVGDYANATSYDGFRFDFYADTVLPSDLLVRFRGNGSTFFVSVLPQYNQVGQWHSISVPLSYDFGWIGGSSATFSNALANVSWVEVGFSRSGTSQQSFFMDNFQLTNDLMMIPEPGSGLLVFAGFGLIMARRRLRRKFSRSPTA